MENKLPLYTIAGLVVLLAIVWVATSRNAALPPLPAPEAVPAVPTTTMRQTIAPAVSPAQMAATPLSIKVLLPVQDEQWVIGDNHTIRWSKEAGIPGGIYLVDAGSGVTFGWIVPTTDMHQTSYLWDTSSVFLSRSGGLRKDLQVGRYMIVVRFDKKPAVDIRSAAFSLIYPSQAKTGTYNVAIKNYLFSPAALTVRQGDQVIFTNNDQITQKFVPSGYGNIYTLQPGESGTLNTASLAPGSYGYYSEAYPTMRLTINVTAK